MASLMHILSYVLLAEIQTRNCLTCLSWNITEKQLALTCSTDDINLSTSFYDPNMTEQAHCFLPVPASYCISTNGRVNQDLINDKTVLLLNATPALNGKWTCLHGKDTEQSEKIVTIPNPEGNSTPTVTDVRLQVPKYVRRSQNFVVGCSIFSNELLFDRNVTFLINDKVYVNLYYNETGCQTIQNHEQCNPSKCYCSEDGTQYSVNYNSSDIVGVYKFSCNVDFGFGRLYSDCAISKVIDMDGPHMKSSRELPLQNGTKVEFECFFRLNMPKGYIGKLRWDCLNATNDTIYNPADGYYISAIHLLVLSINDNKHCICRALVEDFEIDSISVKLVTQKELVLLKSKDTKCQESDAVTISCSIINVNDFLKYGYSLWTHSKNGEFVRHLAGVSNEEVYLLHIWNCKDSDMGEYTCSAWGSHSFNKVWSNSSIRVEIEESERHKSSNAYTPYIVIASVILVSLMLVLLVLQRRSLLGNSAREGVVYHTAQADTPVNSIYLTTESHYEEIENIEIPVEEGLEDVQSDKSSSESLVNENSHDYLDPC